MPKGKKELLKRLAAEERLALALDFDGTLAPIRPDPADARLSPRALSLLTRLARAPGVKLAFVSGRSLADIRRKAPVREAAFLGNHGLEAADRGWAWTQTAAGRSRSKLGALAQVLEPFVRACPGAVLENKGLSLSLHYRGVRSASRLRALILAVDEAWEQGREGLRRSYGKKVWEFRPGLSWDKGRGLKEWRKALAVPGRLVFIGDDQTDEEGFKSLGASCLSVRVGPGPTGAAYRLSQKEVLLLLAELLKGRKA